MRTVKIYLSARRKVLDPWQPSSDHSKFRGVSNWWNGKIKIMKKVLFHCLSRQGLLATMDGTSDKRNRFFFVLCLLVIWLAWVPPWQDSSVEQNEKKKSPTILRSESKRLFWMRLLLCWMSHFLFLDLNKAKRNDTFWSYIPYLSHWFCSGGEFTRLCKQYPPIPLDMMIKQRPEILVCTGTAATYQGLLHSEGAGSGDQWEAWEVVAGEWG